MDILLKEIQELTEKIKKDSNNKQLYRERATLYNRINRFELALKDYDTIINIDPKDDNAYYERICEWYNWKIYYLDEVPNAEDIKKNTIDYLEEALKINKLPKYYYRIGEIYFNLLSENEKALNSCKNALLIGGESLEVFKLIGEIYNELGDFNEAIESLNRAIDIEEDSDAYFFRGISYVNLAMTVRSKIAESVSLYKKAIKDYNQAIKLDQKNIVLYFRRAELYYEVFREKEKAIEDYMKVLELEPDNEDAYIRLAEIYFELREIKKQELCYKEVIKINPNNLIVNEQLASYYYSQNKYKEALGYINVALELGSDEEWLNLAQGECYYEIHEYNRALEVYCKIINSNNNLGYDYRGDVYMALKQYDKAIKDYEKFIELKPESKGVYYRLGLAYYKNENYDKAIESLNKAILLLPNNKKILDLMETINNTKLK